MKAEELMMKEKRTNFWEKYNRVPSYKELNKEIDFAKQQELGRMEILDSWLFHQQMKDKRRNHWINRSLNRNIRSS
jgi:hypothetical protein